MLSHSNVAFSAFTCTLIVCLKPQFLECHVNKKYDFHNQVKGLRESRLTQVKFCWRNTITGPWKPLITFLNEHVQEKRADKETDTKKHC